MRIAFPIFVIGNADGVLVLTSDGNDCILLFHDRQHADRHISEARKIGSDLPMFPLAIPDAVALREGIGTLPADVTCAIWDATLSGGSFTHVGVDEILESVGSAE